MWRTGGGGWVVVVIYRWKTGWNLGYVNGRKSEEGWEKILTEDRKEAGLVSKIGGQI